MCTNNTEEAYIQFGQWLEKQSFWLQDATWCMYNGVTIDDAKIVEYADMCIEQLEKAKPKFNKIDEGDLSDITSVKELAVLEVSDLKNVNALSKDAKLTFKSEGINVVYGLNGAGKSGFMRLFKHVSGSPYKEIIQTNVFIKSSETIPFCNFKVIEDGKEKFFEINLTEEHRNSALNLIDVFDTRISTEYISKTNSVSYQPFVFSVLTELVAVGNRISTYLNNQIEKITETKLEIPPEFIGAEELAWLQELETIEKIPDDTFLFEEDDEKMLVSIDKELDLENRNEKIKAYKIKIETLEALCKDLSNLAKSYKEINLEEKESDYLQKKSLLKKTKRIFNENANPYDQISINSEEWKQLWNSAQDYYEECLKEHLKKEFAQEDSICPLCHQVLKGNIQKRFVSVNDNINGKYQKDLDELSSEINQIAKILALRSFSVVQLTPTIQKLLNDETVNDLKSLYNKLEKLKTEKNTIKMINLMKSLTYDDSLNNIKGVILEFKDNLEKLESLSIEDVYKEKEGQLLELKVKKWLHENKELIEKIQLNLKKIKTYKKADGLTRSNKITIQSNTMAERLITDAYIERFQNEIKTLAPSLNVKLEKARSVKGRTPYKITINTSMNVNCKPEDILSEGEQRIVSLATFFADASGRKDYAPIVIDDPISSLDVKYEEAATMRMVELAKKRQVIIFTHRISLIKSLEEFSGKENVELNQLYIRSGMNEKGLLDFKDVYHGNVIRKLNGLDGELKRLRKVDPDGRDFENGIGNICKKFRIAIERSVEDPLLQGVVTRFDHQIRTKDKILKLSRIEEDDCRIVDSMMTKYSYYEHSQPIERPISLPNIDELEKDITLYIEWLKKLKTRMK